MPASASYNDLLQTMLQDQDRAVAYLNAALDEEDPRLFLVALRNVTHARGGVGKIARRTGLNRETLYRTLSAKGNPSVQTLAAILSALGARLSIDRIKNVYRPAGMRSPIFTFTMSGRTGPSFSWQCPQPVRGIQLAAA